jgi:uncharacterized protein YdiU (UPF0061 family)
MLQVLADYVIDRFYPECRLTSAGEPATPQAAVVRLLDAVTVRTAKLMAAWQCVGFCHGVMNTDNMSILGLTLDYGPYGFMDGFRLNHICNHSDSEGRYAWNRQPSVGLWNLFRLAGSLQALAQDSDALKAVLDGYEGVFTGAFHGGMAAKLGLDAWRPDDEALLDDLLKLMHDQQADFTLAFRRLSAAVRGDGQPFADLFMDRDAARAWLSRLLDRHAQDGRSAEARAQAMDAVNPLYVLRNHLAEEAIRAAHRGDASEIEQLLDALATPYTEQARHARYGNLPPTWANDLEVSCSS